MKLLPLILTTLILIAAVGCYDYKDVSSTSIVAGLGIDPTESGYAYTFEIVKTKDAPQDEPPKADVVTVTAANLRAAALEAERQMYPKLFFGALKVTVLAQALHQDAPSIAEELLSDLEIPDNTNIIISESAQKAFGSGDTGGIVAFRINDALSALDYDKTSATELVTLINTDDAWVLPRFIDGRLTLE